MSLSNKIDQDDNGTIFLDIENVREFIKELKEKIPHTDKDVEICEIIDKLAGEKLCE
jgi:hypothetical protein